MIDTIKLEIPINELEGPFRTNDFKFGAKSKIEEESIDNMTVGYKTSILINWPPKLKNYYVPRVTFVDYPNRLGGRVYAYTIEASLPKLVYGNNLQELSEQDFTDIVDKLYKLIQKLNLPRKISREELKQSTVRRVDYCKNIKFENGATMQSVNTLLERAEFRKTSRAGKITHQYSGELYKEEIDHRRFIAYDKLEEIKATYKKARPAFEPKAPYIDPKKLGELAKKQKGLSVLRFELQITSTKQLRWELDKEGYNRNNISFADIFCDELAGHFLMKYWSRLVDKISREETSCLTITGAQDTFNRIAINQSDERPQLAFARFGFKVLNDLIGLGPLRTLYEHHFRADTWYRNRNNLQSKDIFGLDNSSYDAIDATTEQFKELEQKGIMEWLNENGIL